ncbi:MAG TPA: MBL fold metallo-hydrolase [Myxococcaceae bacterium]|nr:MBL fold metallo-hydrolase [Myxococcaceae bacterium]
MKREARAADFHVKFWGVRGSIPAPGATTRRYGGNTPCVEVRCGRELLIFDLGSGVRSLGQEYPPPLKAHIFLSHYHYDHLQGMPFFTPLFVPANEFAVYGPTRAGKTVQEILSGQMQQPYFPVTAEMVFRAKVDYRSFGAGEEVKVGEARVTAVELNHPGGNLGYRVDYKGHSVVYATDIEHGSVEVDERLARFARETDLLIYDAMYTEDEYRGRVGAPKTGWGHSTWQASIQAADRAQAKTLVLFHHEPTRDDAGMEKMLREVKRFRPEAVAARELQVIDVV